MGGKNGNKKHGRNEADCKRYEIEGRAEKSKAIRLADHISRCPWDAVARRAFDALPIIARKGLELPALSKSPATIRSQAGVTLSHPAA